MSAEIITVSICMDVIVAVIGVRQRVVKVWTKDGRCCGLASRRCGGRSAQLSISPS